MRGLLKLMLFPSRPLVCLLVGLMLHPMVGRVVNWKQISEGKWLTS